MTEALIYNMFPRSEKYCRAPPTIASVLAGHPTQAIVSESIIGMLAVNLHHGEKSQKSAQQSLILVADRQQASTTGLASEQIQPQEIAPGKPRNASVSKKWQLPFPPNIVHKSYSGCGLVFSWENALFMRKRKKKDSSDCPTIATADTTTAEQNKNAPTEPEPEQVADSGSNSQLVNKTMSLLPYDKRQRESEQQNIGSKPELPESLADETISMSSHEAQHKLERGNDTADLHDTADPYAIGSVNPIDPVNSIDATKTTTVDSLKVPPQPTHKPRSSSAQSQKPDIGLHDNPRLIRKKSGELLRPALQPSPHHRPATAHSMPTLSKAVHFDAQLEEVCYFSQLECPLTVSSGPSSPVDNSDRDGLKYSYELILTRFPTALSAARMALPVRLERVWLSTDQQSLIGTVAVLNLTFSKHVWCRFSLDGWTTMSEVAADYVAEILPRITKQGHDRFQFTVPLTDTVDWERKTLHLCVRCAMDGCEFWDSNEGHNFQVEFWKRILPARRIGIDDTHHLPALRHASLPNLRDKFIGGRMRPEKMDLSLQDDLGEPSLRLKTPQNVRSASSQGALSNRYDFGISLDVTMQAYQDAPSKEVAAPKDPGNSNITAESYDDILRKYCFHVPDHASEPADPTTQNHKPIPADKQTLPTLLGCP